MDVLHTYDSEMNDILRGAIKSKLISVRELKVITKFPMEL
jgi:hypothetical protein